MNHFYGKLFSTTGAVLGILACCLLVGCSQDPKVKRQRLLESGQTYFDKGDYQAANIQFRRALQTDPAFALAHYKLGLTSLKLQNWADAYRAFTRTVELEPRNIDAWLQKGELEMLTRQWQDAIQSAAAVLEVDPNHPGGHLLLGRVAFRRNDYKKAQEHFSQAVVLAPSDPRALTELADSYLLQKQYAQAKSAYLQAIEIDKSFYAAYLNLAQLYRAEQNDAEQVATLKRAIENNPHAIAAYIMLADAHMQRGRKDQLEQVFSSLRSNAENSSMALLAIGNYYTLSGEMARAQQVLEEALARAPENIDARKRLVQVELNLQKWNEAEKLNAELLRQRPRDPEGRLFRSQLLLVRGNRSQAITDLEQLVTDVPDLARAHLTLGLAYADQGELGRGAAKVKDSLEHDPNLLLGYLVLSELHLRQGEAKLALADAQALLARRPGLVAAQMARINAQLVMGNTTAAKNELLSLAAAQPNNAVFQERLGYIALQQQQFAAAEKHLERALELQPDFPLAMRHVAELYHRQKRVPELRARVQAQIDRVPGQSDYYELLAVTYLVEQDDAHAEAALRKAIQLNSNAHLAYLQLAQLYAKQQKLNEAIAEAEALVQRRPEMIAAYLLLGGWYQSTGAIDKAEQAYTRALDKDPNHVVALNNLAWLYSEHGRNLDVALSLAQRAKENAPDNPNISDTLGWIQFRKGMYSSAAQQFSSALRTAPEEGLYHYHLGRALLELGNSGQGRASLKRALALNLSPANADEAKRILSR